LPSPARHSRHRLTRSSARPTRTEPLGSTVQASIASVVCRRRRPPRELAAPLRWIALARTPSDAVATALSVYCASSQVLSQLGEHREGARRPLPAHLSPHKGNRHALRALSLRCAALCRASAAKALELARAQVARPNRLRPAAQLAASASLSSALDTSARRSRRSPAKHEGHSHCLTDHSTAILGPSDVVLRPCPPFSLHCPARRPPSFLLAHALISWKNSIETSATKPDLSRFWNGSWASASGASERGQLATRREGAGDERRARGGTHCAPRCRRCPGRTPRTGGTRLRRGEEQASARARAGRGGEVVERGRVERGDEGRRGLTAVTSAAVGERVRLLVRVGARDGDGEELLELVTLARVSEGARKDDGLAGRGRGLRHGGWWW